MARKYTALMSAFPDKMQVPLPALRTCCTAQHHQHQDDPLPLSFCHRNSQFLQHQDEPEPLSSSSLARLLSSHMQQPISDSPPSLDSLLPSCLPSYACPAPALHTFSMPSSMHSFLPDTGHVDRDSDSTAAAAVTDSTGGCVLTRPHQSIAPYALRSNNCTSSQQTLGSILSLSPGGSVFLGLDSGSSLPADSDPDPVLQMDHDISDGVPLSVWQVPTHKRGHSNQHISDMYDLDDGARGGSSSRGQQQEQQQQQRHPHCQRFPKRPLQPLGPDSEEQAWESSALAGPWDVHIKGAAESRGGEHRQKDPDVRMRVPPNTDDHFLLSHCRQTRQRKYAEGDVLEETRLPPTGAIRDEEPAAIFELDFDTSFYDVRSPQLQQCKLHPSHTRQMGTPGVAAEQEPQTTNTAPGATADQAAERHAIMQSDERNVQLLPSSPRCDPGMQACTATVPNLPTRLGQAVAEGHTQHMADMQGKGAEADNGAVECDRVCGVEEDSQGDDGAKDVTFATRMGYLRPYPGLATAALDRVEAGISLGGRGMSQHQQHNPHQRHRQDTHHQTPLCAEQLPAVQHRTAVQGNDAGRPGQHAQHLAAEVVVIDDCDGGDGEESLQVAEGGADQACRQQQQPVMRAPFRAPRPRPSSELAHTPAELPHVRNAAVGTGTNAKSKASAKTPSVVNVGRRGLVGMGLHGAKKDKAAGDHTQRRLTDLDKFALSAPSRNASRQ